MAIKITHYHAEDEQIELMSGDSSIPAIVQLAAITELRKCKFVGNHYSLQYPTNSEGLNIAIDQAEQIINGLSDAIGAISLLMCHVDGNELGDSIKPIGFLLSALSELIGYVNFHSSEMQACLENQHAQKNPTK